jgi:ATP-dependent Lon protease
VLIKTLTEQLEYLGKNNPFFSEQVKVTIENAENPARIADFVASILGDVEKERLQEILETPDVYKRLEKVATILEERINMMKIQEKIVGNINKKIEKQQREFFLKEQMKEIRKELGEETDQKSKDIQKFREMYDELEMEGEAKETVESELDKFEALDPRSPEYVVAYNYLDTVLSLPWNHFTKETHDLEKAQKLLDGSHYGLKDIKERILEFLAIRKLKPEAKGSIICFVGPPGVGKTSLGRAIADALSRPFFRFSVGGMRDEAEIKGHRRTYIGAMPGKIVQGLKIVKSKNPVFMIDEIDKMGTSYQGDPASALLEVLDPEQNSDFRDHYLDMPFDLSNILFITTANTLDTIPPVLTDRMEVIRLSGYIADEKYQIGKKFILGRQQERHGLDKKDFILTKKAFFYIAERYSREAGVRNFERQIARICRKLAYKKAMEQSFPKKLGEKQVREILGPEIFTDDEKKRIKKPGVAIGLAWTSMGGDTLYIEAIKVQSRQSGLKLTGKLGEVMQESANIAFSYIRNLAIEKFKVEPEVFEKNIVHLHVPAGAVPKDGPSAGITMASSLLSLILGRKLKKDLAMTGELTLSGAVLPVGGIREKIIAANRANIKTLLLPQENERDLEEVPDHIKKNLTFHFVASMEDVVEHLFEEQ